MKIRLHHTATKWACCTAAGLMLAILAACGAGSDNAVPLNSAPPGGGPAQSTGGVTLELTDGNGAASTVVTVGKPLTVVATVRDGRGAPLANALTAFSVDPTLARVSAANGAVATDAAGRATVTLSAASATGSGAGLLKVAAIAGGLNLQGQAVFTTGPSKLELKVITPDTGTATLRAYDSTLITIDALVEGKPFTIQPVTLDLASVCTGMGKASLPAQVTTVNGRAQFVYRDQGCTQSDVVTASLAGAATSATINVQATSPDAVSIQMSNVDPVDRTIVLKGSGGNGRTETAIVKFKVFDQFRNPVANQKVAFAIISTKPVTLNKTSDTTDANGEVVTTVSSGTEPTAVRVQATLPNGLSTISDSIAVTTGVPIQLAFSLSARSFNIEGFNYDNEQDDITLLLADQFGNPVADGVPVVFQVDSGAVGSSVNGGCNTVNGGCTVKLRSQAPRYHTDATAPRQRAGLATISVSTLNNTSVPLTGEIAVFFSGSFVENATATLENGQEVSAMGPIWLDRNTCGPVSLNLRISDKRFNPLPSGTTISSGSADNVSVSGIYPSSIPSIAPHYSNGVVVGDQGSYHLVLVKPDEAKCKDDGANRGSGSVSVVVTTPRGNVTRIPIGLTFPIK
jgi:hypothetical protein